MRLANGLFMLVFCAAAVLPGFAAPSEAITAARFSITIDGYEVASFSELAGISSSVDAVGSSAARSHTVTLRRGMTRSLEMAAWHELVILGDVAAARKSASLTAYGSDGRPVARYHLTDAWPSKIEIGTLKAGSSEVLMETVTLTCEFIQRVST